MPVASWSGAVATTVQSPQPPSRHNTLVPGSWTVSLRKSISVVHGGTLGFTKERIGENNYEENLPLKTKF